MSLWICLAWITALIGVGDIGFDIEKTSIRGEYLIEDYIFQYGSISKDNNTDGLLIIKEFESEEEIFNIVYDNGGLETFKYLADIGNNQILIVCEEYYKTIGFDAPRWKQMSIILYDFNGEQINQIHIDDHILSYHNHHDHLVIEIEDSFLYIDSSLVMKDCLEIPTEYDGSYDCQFQGEAVVNGIPVDILSLARSGYYDIVITDEDYSYEFSIIIHPSFSIEGETFNDDYVGSVTLSGSEDIWVNDVLYNDADLISVPGYYDVRIVGENDYVFQTRFAILPEVTVHTGYTNTPFISDMILYEPIRIYTNGISMVLNQNPYVSDWITETGHYTISIYGINNLVYHLEFSLYPNVNGVEDQGRYDVVDLELFGTALLNGKTVSGSVHLDEPGEYELSLIFENEVTETMRFTIETSEVKPEEESWFINNLNIIFIIVLGIGGYIILRKK